MLSKKAKCYPTRLQMQLRMLISWMWGGEIVLNYPDELNVIIWILKSEKRGGKKKSEWDVKRTQLPLLALKMEEVATTTKNVRTSAAKSIQSCPTLFYPIDGTPPGSPIPGILQARTLEWVAISFSNAWKWKVKSEIEVSQSCLTLCDPIDCSPPGSSLHGFSRQEYWSGVPLPSL